MDTKLAKKLNVNATTIGEIIDLRTPRLNEGNTSTVYIDGYMINSEDDINGCLVAPELNTNGTICFRLLARKKVNGVNIYRGLSIGVKADGSIFTNLERSQDNSSIVTTVSHGSNYVRFGNGIQICWGRVNVNGPVSSTNVKVNFPQPFSNIPCVLSCGNANIGPVPIYIGWETSVSFNIGFAEGASGTGFTNWIAIGYWY